MTSYYYVTCLVLLLTTSSMISVINVNGQAPSADLTELGLDDVDPEYIHHVDKTDEDSGYAKPVDVNTINPSEYGVNTVQELMELDGSATCKRLAYVGKCIGNDEMVTVCTQSCRDWAAETEDKVVYVDMDSGEDTFYDLTARLHHNDKKVNFERFEGYLTVVCNIGKICDDTRDIEQTILAMQSLFKIMPYSLNILLFPFEIPTIDYTVKETGDCTNYDKIIAEASKEKLFHNKLFIMEQATLNGPKTHPVYKYLKEVTTKKEVVESFSTFFFINGEGTKIEALPGASFSTLRSYIIGLTRDGYGL